MATSPEAPVLDRTGNTPMDPLLTPPASPDMSPTLVDPAVEQPNTGNNGHGVSRGFDKIFKPVLGPVVRKVENRRSKAASKLSYLSTEPSEEFPYVGVDTRFYGLRDEDDREIPHSKHRPDYAKARYVPEEEKPKTPKEVESKARVDVRNAYLDEVREERAQKSKDDFKKEGEARLAANNAYLERKRAETGKHPIEDEDNVDDPSWLDSIKNTGDLHWRVLRRQIDKVPGVGKVSTRKKHDKHLKGLEKLDEQYDDPDQLEDNPDVDRSPSRRKHKRALKGLKTLDKQHRNRNRYPDSIGINDPGLVVGQEQLDKDDTAAPEAKASAPFDQDNQDPTPASKPNHSVPKRKTGGVHSPDPVDPTPTVKPGHSVPKRKTGGGNTSQSDLPAQVDEVQTELQPDIDVTQEIHLSTAEVKKLERAKKLKIIGAVALVGAGVVGVALLAKANANRRSKSK